jgi:hypothetical protein
VVVGEHDRRGPVANAKLAENAPDVRLYRRLGDAQGAGDLAVSRTACDQAQNVSLALGEQLESRRPTACWRDPQALMIEDPWRHRRIEPGRAASHRPHRRD